VCDASTWRGTQRRHGITVAPGKCQDQSGSTARWGTNGARDDEFIGPPACLPACLSAARQRSRRCQPQQ